MTYYLFLIFAWTTYYFLHSFLASNTVKQWAEKKMGRHYKWYRIIFNVIAIVGLAVLLGIPHDNELQLQFEFPGRVWIAGGLLLVGGLLGYFSFRNYRTSEFLGFQQLHQETVEKAQVELQTGGMNRWVRHPLYFSSIIILCGYVLYSLTLTSVIIFGITVVYLWIGAHLEEKKLLLIYGEEYERYKREVNMLIPYIL